MNNTLTSIVEKMISSIGQGPIITNEEYTQLMANIDFLDKTKIEDYQIACIMWLLNNKGNNMACPQILGNNPQLGDCLEWYLGLHRNNSGLGDLLGLELKSWDGRTPFSFITYSAEKELKEFYEVNNINHILCGEKHGSLCSSQSCFDNRHVFYRNESIYYNTENKLKKMKFTINDRNFIQWITFNNNSWHLVGEKNIHSMLVKYRRGLLVVTRTGIRKEKSFIIDDVYYVPLNEKKIIDLIRTEKIYYEIRYKKDKKKTNSKEWDGKSYKSTGWGLRMKSGDFKKCFLIPENRLVGDDRKDILKKIITSDAETTEISILDEFFR